MVREDQNIERGSGYSGTNKGIWDSVRFPGIGSAAPAISRLTVELPRRFAALQYREGLPCLWIIFVGGTGTGKSTLFNAFCGEEISATGAERPKTQGPILYCHQDCLPEEGFPFPGYTEDRIPIEKGQPKPAQGSPGQLLIHEHRRDTWSRFVVADTPDLDSVEAEHRKVAQDLCLLCDTVVFVTSQEKYADEVPYQFLANVVQRGDSCFFLLNKAQGDLIPEEVRTILEREGITLEMDRIWFVPRQPATGSAEISHHPDFQDFAARLSEEIFHPDPGKVHRTTQKRRAAGLAKSLGELIELLESENRAARAWMQRLEGVQKKISRDLLRSEGEQFAEQSRRHLAREIRQLFSRYDLLAGPRRFLREIILKPFRLVGLGKTPEERTLEDNLQEIRKKMDITPIMASVEAFHREILDVLSPKTEKAPLFHALRQPGLPLSQEEIRKRLWRQQEELASWLEVKFQELSRGIPAGKKAGIYGTSIMWGMLIIAFETAVGGGFTVLDAALDSVLAPLVTKGSVELFAYREIRIVARELAKRYEEGLLSLLDEQRKRYEHALQSLLTGPDTLQQLKKLQAKAARW